MLTLIIGTIITLILQMLPGYLLSSISIFRNDSTIERVYFGYIITMAISILFGFISSTFKMFTPLWMLIFLIIYNILSIIIYRKYSINSNSNHTKNQKTILIIFLYLVMIIICFRYVYLSYFPIGWDRGKHFGRIIYSLNYHTFETKHPGTYYKPFYFQGLNIIYSIFVGMVLSFSKFNATFNVYDFNILLDLSIIFKFYISFLISLTLIAIYFISNHIYKDTKTAILSSIILISLAGWDIVETPSISTYLVFLFLSVFVIYLDFIVKSKFSKVNYIFFFLIINSIVFIHIIGIAFMILYSMFTLFWKLLRKEINIKIFQKIIVFIVISMLFNLLFLSIFHPSLIHGIFDEIYRRNLITMEYWARERNWISPTGLQQGSYSLYGIFLNYFTQNLNKLLEGGEILYITFLFLIIGFYFDVSNKSYTILFLMFVSLLFVIIPILTFIKTECYLIYPLSILSGRGLFYLLYKKFSIKDRNPIRIIFYKNFSIKVRKPKIIIIILIYLVIGATVSTNSVVKSGLRRCHMYSYDFYQEQYNLSIWLNRQLESPYTILFPEAGPFGYLLNALCHHKILMADPRFPDLPLFQETAKIYVIFPTYMSTYDYRNVSGRERYDIIQKYNISVIIETTTKTDLESLQLYTNVETYHPTPSCWVIILGMDKSSSSLSN